MSGKASVTEPLVRKLVVWSEEQGFILRREAYGNNRLSFMNE